ncbi:MAG: hypothetical protein JOZ15_08995 [Acidobacteria bacterium]|nr:hypothetical protein [Acidobacteriota bacterium]
MRSTRLPSWSRRLLGFTPLPSPPHVFALDDVRLRYAHLAADRQGLRLRAFRELALPRDAYHNGPLGGPLRDPGAFQELAGGILEGLPGAVREASLVVPDAWLRVTYAESGDLPRGAAALDEVLRWKLRRLVPFRVDELRIGAAEVQPLPRQEEPRRLLMGFAVEQLLAQLEDAFAAHGVRLGHVGNVSLALLDALAARGTQGAGVPPAGPPPAGQAGGAAGGLAGAGGRGRASFMAVALVADDGYTLIFARRGEPVLHRYKGTPAGAPESGPGGPVVRDLRLTRNFLDENFPEAALESVLLLAPPALEPLWLDRLQQGLGRRAAPVNAAVLPPVRGEGVAPVPPWRELAPMIGAARRMIA